MADAISEPAARRIRLPDWRGLADLSGRRRTALAVAAAAVLVVAVVGVAAAGGSNAQTYRTATAERATVDSTVESTGTIAPLNQASLIFPTAGTVAAVPVAIGQHVTVGELLAQLDTTSLDAQVAAAQSSVAAAQSRLAADESGQGGSSASAGGGTSGGTSGGSGSGTSAATGIAPAVFGTGSAVAAVPAMYTTAASPQAPAAPSGPSVADLQAQLVADQHRTDLALTAEKAQLTAEAAACKSFLAGGSATASPSLYVPASGTPAPPGSGTSSNAATPTPAPAPAPSNNAKSGAAAPAPAPAPADATACRNEIGKVIEQQITVSQDEQAVAADEVALNNALGHKAASAGSSAGGAGGAAGGGAGGTGAGGTGGGTGSTGGGGGAAGGGAAGSSGGAGVSAEQLAADQAAIDAASAALAVAQQSLDQAKLVSPIDGTVGAVNIAAGQSVAAGTGSSNPQVVVIGPGTNQVTTTVSDLSVGAVRVGSPARVTPSGSNTPIDGKVVSVGLLGTSTGTTVSYPVTIGLTGASPQLFDGQGATVSIVMAQTSNVLAVPSSAVRTVGANHTVTVLKGGTPTATQVETGAVGATLTEITSGLNAGDEVMLADLSQPLPSTTSGLRGIGGAGGGARPGG